MSVNKITLEHLRMACKHFYEMRGADVTANLAIRPVELFADLYAKWMVTGNTSPHSAKKTALWSKAAASYRDNNPDYKSSSAFRVEHGTPKRAFAWKVLSLYDEDNLNEATMDALVGQHYRLAVIALEEDRHLNRILRSKTLETPEARWAAAGIEF